MAIEIPGELIDRLRKARSIVAFTGAGVSAESGVPTFRAAQTGLWSKYRPEDLATPDAFRRNPKLVWDWYAWRRTVVAKVEPNPGHVALAELERRAPEFLLVTQNVDGLHARAGSRKLVEIHGNIGRTICFNGCGVITDWPATEQSPPPCPRCGGWLRPDVVWFGESLPQQALATAQQAAQHCDLFLSVGTSTVVYPAAELPFIAKQSGAFVVEVNPDATPLSQLADVVLRHPSGKALPAMLRQD